MVREGKSWSKWLYAPIRQRCLPPYSELLQTGYPSPRPKESASGPSTRNRGPPSALTPPAACPPVGRTASTSRPRTIARTPELAATAPTVRIERLLQELLLEEASHTVFLTGMLEGYVRLLVFVGPRSSSPRTFRLPGRRKLPLGYERLRGRAGSCRSPDREVTPLSPAPRAAPSPLSD